MPQTPILAAGTTANTSSDFTVAAGAQVTVSIFTATNSQIPASAELELRVDTAGADALGGILSVHQQAVGVLGPGTFRVFRPPQEVAIGVSLET